MEATTTTTEAPVYERELQIDASPETVWEFLVDPEKVARWKGLPATAFDPRPGGAYRIEIIPGHFASGAFVELERPRRLVYTWGWEPGEDGPNPVPPGSSTVEIELEAGGRRHEAAVHPPRPAGRRGRTVAWRGLGSLPRPARHGGAGRRPRPRPVARRARMSECRLRRVKRPHNEGSMTMGKYVYAYKGGGIPESEEEGKRVMAAWTAWFGGLGDSVVDMGNPFGASAAVGGGSTSGITGYSIVTAGSLDDALAQGRGAVPSSTAATAASRCTRRSTCEMARRQVGVRGAPRLPPPHLHSRAWMPARSACSTPVPVGSPSFTNASSRCRTRISSTSATVRASPTGRGRSTRSAASRARSRTISRARASSSSSPPATPPPPPRSPTCSARCPCRCSASSSPRRMPPSGRREIAASACSPPRRPSRAAATRP